MEDRTDVYGNFAIWIWGKKYPTEVFECQNFMRESPLGDYIRELEGKLPKPETMGREEIIKIIQEVSWAGGRDVYEHYNIGYSPYHGKLADALLGKLPVSKEIDDLNTIRLAHERRIKEQAEELAKMRGVLKEIIRLEYIGNDQELERVNKLLTKISGIAKEALK